jgi:predicted alpha/beta superfamily hydrolase
MRWTNRANAARRSGLSKSLSLGLLAMLLVACADTSQAPVPTSAKHASKQAPATRTMASVAGAQRGEGMPYEIADSQVWNVPDPVSGRDYQVFVALPRSYADDPGRRYPVLYVTDADYAFPLVRQIARRLNGEGPAIDEFVLVGLSYAIGDAPMPSRRRDYTPTPEGGAHAAPDATHGKADAYIAYLRDQVLPFVAQRYRTDEHRRLFLGHSYGGLLGTQILLTAPEMFSGYILGSPSYWYGEHAMQAQETAFAASHTDLPLWAELRHGDGCAEDDADAARAPLSVAAHAAGCPRRRGSPERGPARIHAWAEVSAGDRRAPEGTPVTRHSSWR